MNAKALKLTVIALSMAAAVGGAYSFCHISAIGRADAAVPVAAVAAPSAALPDMGGIVERNGPAVVNISVTGTRQVADSGGLPQLDPDDPFYEFFRRFRAPQPGGEAPVRGLGSGFIITSDGTILTNAHVVEGADEVTVKLTDKREFKAKVRGIDKVSDVAVLKIDAKGLPTVKIGSSTATRVGEWVLAIGSPFGFENSASAGIVSAKSRSLPDGSYVPFIQTDVAVNPGNSGGPLFNMAGEVIGINSQIYSRSGGYQGLSFAIPIEVAMNVEKQIVTNGQVQRGRLGVTIQEINQSLADSFGLKKPAGALVNSVEKGSPAAKAGLEPGDVVLSIDGKDITNSGELAATVAGMRPGDVARLQVWRHGSNKEIAVKVGSASEPKIALQGNEESAKGRLGVAVRSLSPEEQRQADVKGGVLVQNASGAAARAGIQSGDIILSINGQPVTSAEQLRGLLAKAGKHAAVLIERGDTRIFVPVELG
ncbi:serine protease [Oryzomicrobium terrae]|uniref:Probable periplasmic serine endoprotease DegP-like n=1 Tax=Oryzomicrobium terrae TaxID=1735038 RepID=A0A5C1E9I1_9RHOO|nr:DegQ family serine endoprotease [Oryzomicrobium terrae]QEL65552.1 serine protease [Oryzomicrobium terrae]